jgi:hypothetical protein
MKETVTDETRPHVLMHSVALIEFSFHHFQPIEPLLVDVPCVTLTFIRAY